MSYLSFILSLTISTLALAVALPSDIEKDVCYSRARIITFPESNRQATISLYAKLAAVFFAFVPRILMAKECSAWPECDVCRHTAETSVENAGNCGKPEVFEDTDLSFALQACHIRQNSVQL